MTERTPEEQAAWDQAFAPWVAMGLTEAAYWKRHYYGLLTPGLEEVLGDLIERVKPSLRLALEGAYRNGVMAERGHAEVDSRSPTQAAVEANAAFEWWMNSRLRDGWLPDERGCFKAGYLAAAAIRADERARAEGAIADAQTEAAMEQAYRLDERARYEALIEVAREIQSLPIVRGESGVGKTFTMTHRDTGALDRLDAVLKALEGGSNAETV